MKASFIVTIIITVLAAVGCCIILWIDYGIWALAFYGAMILALPLSSLLHELGHILFGAMVKIKAVPHFSLFRSSCCEIIPKTDKNLKKRIIFTITGGLVVNLILLIVGFIGINYMFRLPTYLGVLFPANLYLLGINAIGDGFASGKSDGCLLRELSGNSPSAKVMLAVLTVQAQVLNGKPIEEVDEKLLFDLPVIQEDDQSFIALTELRFEYFKAKGEEEQAEKYRQRLEDLKQYLN